jgi:type II secretion system protein H
MMMTSAAGTCNGTVPASMGVMRNLKAIKGKQGFTLLELLVVIVIIAVMAGILIPSLGNTGRNASSTVERMVLLLNMAQQESIMTSRVWQLVFDAGENRYRFQQMGGVEFEDVRTAPLAGEHEFMPLTIDNLEINGQPISGKNAQVYLFPTGEQDSLLLVLKTGFEEYQVAMGPVGPAWMEEL